MVGDLGSLRNIVLIQPQDNLLFVNDHHYLIEYEANKYES
jgi:ABC-type transport system involved in Fe-S cluster assembly fused permease/ATPase subunit